MRTVNIAELKNQLSRYLDEVRQGQEVVVRDRHRPIAKLVPLDVAEEIGAEERALIASGQLRPARKRLPASFWRLAGLRIAPMKAVAALVADRDSR